MNAPRILAFALAALGAFATLGVRPGFGPDADAPPGGASSMPAVAHPHGQEPMRVRVIDGDTFSDAATGQVYRLAGVDACERDQRAVRAGREWPCGAAASAWLADATRGKPVTCSAVPGAEPYRRTLARCASPDHGDLGAAMIRAGMAVAYRFRGRPVDPAYARLEEKARKERRGMWEGEFEMPSDYRMRRGQEQES